MLFDSLYKLLLDFYSRYCFEVATIISVLTFLLFQLGGEIKNAGVSSFWRNLVILSLTSLMYSLN